MAGDWIKVEKSTPYKPEVLRLSGLLSIHPAHAFGLCFRFWSWADDQLTNGHALGVTEITLDSVIGHAGFTSALINVGWLQVRSGSLVVPHFDRHLSDSAKNRALSGERKKNQRSSVSRSERDKSVTREEKRREEKSIKSTRSKPAPAVVDKVDVPATDEPPAGSVESPKQIQVAPPPYNLIASQYVAAFGGKANLNDTRRSAMRTRWREKFWRENWQAALERGSQSSFLRGGGASGWKIDFDFFLKPNSVLKILEGAYDDGKGGIGPAGRKLTAAEQREQLNAESFQWLRDAASGLEGDSVPPGSPETLLIEKHGPDD